jgi:hypothetical protein
MENVSSFKNYKSITSKLHIKKIHTHAAAYIINIPELNVSADRLSPRNASYICNTKE